MRARWKSGLRLFRRDESVKFRGDDTLQNRLEKKLSNKQSRQSLQNSLSALIADANWELNELPYECYYDEELEEHDTCDALEELRYTLLDESLEDDVFLNNTVISNDYHLASCFE